MPLQLPLLSLAFLAVFAAGAAIGFKWRDNTARLAESKQAQRYTEALNEALDKARRQEHALTQQLNEVAYAYQQAQQQADTLQADISRRINAGTLRLRQQWQQCESDKLRLPATTPASAAGHERAASRTELAAAIVRAGIEADNQLKACQQVIQNYRNIIREQP